MIQLNKSQLIDKVRKLNPLLSQSNWEKNSVEELQRMYDKSIEYGAIKQNGKN